MSFNPKKVRAEVLTHLKLKDIPTNEALPTIDKWVFKSSVEVAERIVSLYALTGLAHEADPISLKEWLSEGQLYSEIPDSEKAYFEKTLSSKDIVDLSWKQEALFAVCWSGSLVREMGLPHSECNLNKVFPQIPPEVEISDFLKTFNLRGEQQIAFQTDLHYCLHWILRHPECWGTSEWPSRLNKDVLIERRRALEWITKSSIKWEDVALDT